MIAIHHDKETCSRADLTKIGAYAYARHTSTDCLLTSGRVEDGPVRRWRPGQPFPYRDIRTKDIEIQAWNSQFERRIWWDIMEPVYGWPHLELEQFVCVAAQARCCAAAPSKLEKAANFLERGYRKNMKGHHHMLKMCRPDKYTDDWSHHTLKNLDILHSYCDDDLLAEWDVGQVLPAWHPDDLEAFWASERINDTGLVVDREFALAATAYADEEKDYFAERLVDITDGQVTTARQFKRVGDWFKKACGEKSAAWAMTRWYDKGEEKHRFDADMRQNLLSEQARDGDFMPEDVAEFVEILDAAGKSTISKFEAISRRAMLDTDGNWRIHGLYMFAGAPQSRRYSSVGIQAHNLVRTVPANANELIEAFKRGSRAEITDLVEAWAKAKNAKAKTEQRKAVPEPIHVLGELVRPTIISDPQDNFDIVWCDWSSIEAVVLPWLTIDVRAEDRLALFRRGEDLYLKTASAICGRKITKEDEHERQAFGKVPELSLGYCLARDTPVLTHTGIKPIAAVLETDLLWDGVEWVKHEGLLDRGVHPVVNVDGIDATPDHSFLVAQKWTLASDIVSKPNTLRQALDTGKANLPLWATFTETPVGCLNTVSIAHAGKKITLSDAAISDPAEARVATIAPRSQALAPAKYTTDMPTYARTPRTGGAYSVELLRRLTAVSTAKTLRSTTTAGAASQCTGHAISAHSSPTLSLLTGGIIRLWRWIARTWTATMRQATSGLSLSWQTGITSERSENYSSASLRWKPVCDIANAGPRNRFTVVTNSGYLIAHNCGGVGAFTAMAKNYGVHLPEAQVVGIVAKWRKENPWAADFAKGLELAAMRAINRPGIGYSHGRIEYLFEEGALGFGRDPHTGKWRGALFAILPSGKRLCYPDARVEDVLSPYGKWKPGITAMKGSWQPAKDATEWPRVSLWNGLLAENCTQAVATGDLLNAALLRAERWGLQVCGHTHDEIKIYTAHAELDAAKLLRCMLTKPKWPGIDMLPLKAEVGFGFRYKVKFPEPERLAERDAQA